MKQLIGITLLCCTLFSTKAQLIDYYKIDHYSIGRLDTLISDVGGGLFFTPEYPVDLYKVLYLTPYKHVDSLVQVSGAVAIPVDPDCPAPLAAYLHGTNAKRTNVPSYQSNETFIGIALAASGDVVTMPDYLGLGDSDSSVIIHPYVHAFSQGHTSVNALRAARWLADSLDLELNGQVFLGGYSQGGFSTVATHKLIEEEFSNEFTITASAPMSGPYDLKDAQVELIVSNDPYPTPGYLPYILLSYHSVFENVQQAFPDVTTVFKSPYDTLIPPLFYNKNESIGSINNLSTPVPKDMIKDTFVNAFITDSLHPLRLALAESHLLDWTPQAPIKLIYCSGDDQVTYLNSERAYDSWTSRGATDIEKADLGNMNHGGCVFPAIIAAKTYFDSFKEDCTTGIAEVQKNNEIVIYPNPADDFLMIRSIQDNIEEILLFDITGKMILEKQAQGNIEKVDLNDFACGIYVLEVKAGSQSSRNKIIIE